mmetsp:Transcript_16301/g.49228  ORF Transcript_16301/g.49228 Transcript_16301/m.49228 type:complete len:219 (+) Transcript_16301:427-1083(+)
MEHRLGRVAVHLLLAPHVGVLKEPKFLHSWHPQELQAKVEIVVLALPGVVDLVLAALGPRAVHVHGGLRQDLNRPVQEVPGGVAFCVLEVDRRIAAIVSRAVPEERLDSDGDHHSVHIQLQGPIVLFVCALLDDLVPGLDEDRRVQRVECALRTSGQRRPQLRVNDGDVDLGSHDLVREEAARRDIADNGVIVASKEACIELPLLDHEPRLRGARSHH